MESFSKNSQFFSSGKHKKALSSLVNQQQLAPNFKIIHSPSLSQTSFFSPQSTIPNISNASQMDNFINNFHTFHKYQQKKPVLKANAQIFAQKKRNFSNPNTKQDSAINVKYKEWLYNNQIENSLILLPEEIKENRNIPIGFQTFNSLSTKNSIKLAKNRQIAQKTENFIEKHLINNEIQANILKESVSRFQKEKFELLSQQIKKETQISSQLSRKILKFKRPKYSKSLVRPSEIDFFEENSENNEAFFHMYVNSINSQDANNKPWVRESSSFILINDKGYLFGGLSNKLLNSLHELDLSKIIKIAK